MNRCDQIAANNDDLEIIDEIDDLPIFHHRYAGIPMDLLEDWVANMMTKNRRNIDEADETEGLSLNNRTVEFLFAFCARMGLAPNVKYTALTLFDKFLVRHVQELRESWKNANNNNNNKETDWQTIEDKVSSQIMLRMFSCVQIASKMENQNKSVKIADFNRLFRGHGLCYTADHVLKSELRVLKTLDYRINVDSPLVHVETLLKILQLQQPHLPIDHWYRTCLKTLEAVTLCRDEIYTRLLEGLLGDGVVVPRLQLVKIQSDNLFLACSIIATAVLVSNGIDVSRQVAMYLNQTTGVSFIDIITFCGAVGERIIQTEPDAAPPNYVGPDEAGPSSWYP